MCREGLHSATCVILSPLFALSGVTEMPDNEALDYIKCFLVQERGRAGLKPAGQQSPPCNLCVVAGWSRLSGRARACPPLLITTQLAGSSPRDVA